MLGTRQRRAVPSISGGAGAFLARLEHWKAPAPVRRSGRLHGAAAGGGHDHLRDFRGVRDHDDVGGTFDLRDLRAHPLVAEPVDAGIYTPVGGPQHRPDRIAETSATQSTTRRPRKRSEPP